MTERYRVVLVDDHARLRALYRIALSMDATFEVVGEAGDGEEGARVARERSPDLVVLDLSMPGRDGLEALQDIKRDVPAARIVVLSGFMRERVEPLVTQLGANGYLEKGLPLAEISGALLRFAREAPRAPAEHVDHDDLRRRVAELI